MTTLFIEADGRLLVFSSVEMAEEHLEPYGVYKRAFSTAGELFTIETGGEGVVIRAAERPADPDSLCELLRCSLRDAGAAFPSDADLPTLVTATEAFWSKRQRLATTISRWGCMAVVVILIGLATFMWA